MRQKSERATAKGETVKKNSLGQRGLLLRWNGRGSDGLGAFALFERTPGRADELLEQALPVQSPDVRPLLRDLVQLEHIHFPFRHGGAVVRAGLHRHLKDLRRIRGTVVGSCKIAVQFAEDHGCFVAQKLQLGYGAHELLIG